MFHRVNHVSLCSILSSLYATLGTVSVVGMHVAHRRHPMSLVGFGRALWQDIRTLCMRTHFGAQALGGGCAQGRGRNEESSVSLDYLSSLHEKHETWFKPNRKLYLPENELAPGQLVTPKVSARRSVAGDLRYRSAGSGEGPHVGWPVG